MFKSVVSKTILFSTLVCVLMFILCSEAQEEEDIPCVHLGDSSTWPKQLLDDLEACKNDPSEAQTDQTLNRKQEKNKKFLKKIWKKLLKRTSKAERAKILECMWARQNIYNVEENAIDWDEVDNLIDSLKISAERKDSLKAAVEECIEENNENQLKKMSKCFIKKKCTIAACPELKRKRKNYPLCKSKGHEKNNNNETPTNDNDEGNNDNEGGNNDNEEDNNDNEGDNYDDNGDNEENSTAGGDENIEETTVYNEDETTAYDGDDATPFNVHYDN